MTGKKAREILAEARKKWTENNIQSRVNPSITTLDAVVIIDAAINEIGDQQKLSPLFEKRVYQVLKNQRRPRY